MPQQQEQPTKRTVSFSIRPEEKIIDDDSPSCEYISIRKGKHGIKNCIFINWDDAEVFVLDAEQHEVCEYRTFPTFPEAEAYLKEAAAQQHNQNDSSNNKKNETTIGQLTDSIKESTLEEREEEEHDIPSSKLSTKDENGNVVVDPVLSAISASIRVGTSSNTNSSTNAKPVTGSAASSSVSNSIRSTQSSKSDVSRASIPSLYDTLLEKKKEDPYKYYEVIKVIGDGSMGSVAQVKKRKSLYGSGNRASAIKSCVSKNSLISNITMDPALNVDDDLDEDETSSNDNDNDDSSAINRKTKRIEVSNMYGHTPYALKSIVVDHLSDPVFMKELQNEVDILRTLDHPNICKALEIYEYMDHMYLVLELCSGGDLYSRDPYDEDQAKDIVESILDAVAYLHLHNVTHRDLKYENIMFASPTSPTVKIIDFGLSKKYGNDEVMKQTCGTVHTMAPEVLKGNGYDNKCDVWSIGVLAFMLCSSALPFFGRTNQVTARKIIAGKFGFKGPRWKTLSSEAKDFITSLLVRDTSKRPDCKKAMKHKWLNDDDDDDDDDNDQYDADDDATAKDEKNNNNNNNNVGGLQPSFQTQKNKIKRRLRRRRKNKSADGKQIVSTAVMDRVQTTIQIYSTYPGMKKFALYIIAHKSTADEIGFLNQLFCHRFDTTKDGGINYDEFKEALDVYSYEDDDLKSMFTAIDLDRTGHISYLEFLASTIEARGTIDEERIIEAFSKLDHDDNGYITVSDLRKFVFDRVSTEFIENAIAQVDVSGNKKIDYDEFLYMFTNPNLSFEEEFQRIFESVRQRRFKRETRISEISDLVIQEELSSPESLEEDQNEYFALNKAKSIRAAITNSFTKMQHNIKK